MNGVKFDDIHSYFDLHLILSGCSISPATPKTNYVDIPGGDGSIDLTEALGDVKYSDRTGKLVFSVLPSDDFEEKKSEVANLLNGQKFKITFDKDPDWYYTGRCIINEHKCDKRVGTITVDLKLNPWKLKVNETIVRISGDRLFEYEFILKNSKMPVCPTFTSKYGFDLLFKGEWFSTIETNKVKWLDVQLTEGDNLVEIYPSEGFGVDEEITITYQEGSL